MYLNKERKEIVFSHEDIVRMLTPMMDEIVKKNNEFHNLNLIPDSILIPIEGAKLLGIKIKTEPYSYHHG